MYAPDSCPMCKEKVKWVKVDVSHKGFSVGKAVVGGLIAGPAVGLLSGSIGKKKVCYCCGNCGFTHEYNE